LASLFNIRLDADIPGVWVFVVWLEFGFGGLLCPAWASAIRLAAQALPLCGAAPTFLCSGKEK
jgi:hypothetical protein